MKKLFSFEYSNGNLACEEKRAQRAIDKQPSAKISPKTFLCGQQEKSAEKSKKHAGSARECAGVQVKSSATFSAREN